MFLYSNISGIKHLSSALGILNLIFLVFQNWKSWVTMKMCSKSI